MASVMISRLNNDAFKLLKGAAMRILQQQIRRFIIMKEYWRENSLVNPNELEFGTHPYVCVTGDTHADMDWMKLNTQRFPEQKTMTRNDVLIIAGDFGGIWSGRNDDGSESRSDDYFLKFYEMRHFTTLFIDGNHENFSALASYPVVEYAGAKCHQIRPHVYHVMRGEVLHIAGHRIWCIGGAESNDKDRRIPYKSWWPEEIPTEEEWRHAEKMLLKERPDIIITHEAPYKVYEAFNMYGYHPNPVSERFDRIFGMIRRNEIPVMTWYFGHHHKDRVAEIDGIRFRCLFQKIEAARCLNPEYYRLPDGTLTAELNWGEDVGAERWWE